MYISVFSAYSNNSSKDRQLPATEAGARRTIEAGDGAYANSSDSESDIVSWGNSVCV